jgi:hypothetical protein
LLSKEDAFKNTMNSHGFKKYTWKLPCDLFMQFVSYIALQYFLNNDSSSNLPPQPMNEQFLGYGPGHDVDAVAMEISSDEDLPVWTSEDEQEGYSETEDQEEDQTEAQVMSCASDDTFLHLDDMDTESVEGNRTHALEDSDEGAQEIVHK